MQLSCVKVGRRSIKKENRVSSHHQSQHRFKPGFDVLHKKTSSDLHAVHKGHMHWAEDRLADHPHGQSVKAFWAKLMEGLYYPFDPTYFMEYAEGFYGEVPPPIATQIGIIAKLAQEFRGRVSVVVWESLASIAVQTEASDSVAASIRGRKDLIVPWQEVDIVLHAIAKPYDFFMHVQTRFCEAGFLLAHFGECGCCIREAGPDKIRCYLRDNLKRPATEALMKHLHTEGVTILGDELPHAASPAS